MTGIAVERLTQENVDAVNAFYINEPAGLPEFIDPLTNKPTGLLYLPFGKIAADLLGITFPDITDKLEAAMHLSRNLQHCGKYLPIVVGVTVDRETRYLKNGKYFGRPNKTGHAVLAPSELVPEEDSLVVPIVEEGLGLIEDELYSEM